LLKKKIILNIFSFQGHRTLKRRSKFISKNLFFVDLKLNDQKLEFNTSLNIFNNIHIKDKARFQNPVQGEKGGRGIFRILYMHWLLILA